jgi:protein SCO1
MNKRWILYVSFFVLLLAAFYVLIFNNVDFSQSQLPVINNYIQPFTFVDQDGKKITEKSVEGKVYVAAYFFTTCRGICPKMNANMRRVFDAYKNEEDFLILSHTCMPETDSVPALKKYALKMVNGKLIKNEDDMYRIEYDSSMISTPEIKNTSWHFVTGDKAALYNLARHSYLIDSNLGDSTSKIEDQFIHTQFFALVDKQSRLRAIYDGLKEDEIQKLLKDIKGLLKENYQTRSLK